MRKTFGFVGLLVLVSPGVRADCAAQSAAEHPHLVELYTAEGCSSCPPAERWMSSLRASKDYIGLEFHVDYFDAQGWRDPFADPRYTARQHESAKRGVIDTHFHTEAGMVYTPQVIVDGRVWKNWPKAAPPALASTEGPGLTLDVTPGAAIRAKVVATSSPALASSYRIYLALTANGLHSSVKAGENRGKQLAHDLVVRDLAGPFELPQAEAELKTPADFDRANSAVVTFVEDSKSGEIVQALRLPLAQCSP
jgi:hypothetical protein